MAWCPFFFLTFIIHVHGDGLSRHGEERQEVLLSVVHFKRVAVESHGLDAALLADAGDVPCGNLIIAEAQNLAAFKHVAVDGF